MAHNGNVAQGATDAAKQITRISNVERWVVIEVSSGTWPDFQKDGREQGIGVFRAQYPDIFLQIMFSDGTEKEYK